MRNNPLLIVLFLLLSAKIYAQVPYYTVKFPDDVTIASCGLVPVNTQPVINYIANCGFNVGVSFNDQTFYSNDPQTCAKIFRTWTLVWWCDYDPNTYTPVIVPNPGNTDTGPTVQGNSVNHGYLKYTQIIKILDNVPPVFLNCPTGPVTFCDLTSNDPAQYNQSGYDRCEGPVNLSVKVTDVCSKSDVNVSYRLFLDMDGNGSMETLVNSSAPTAWPIQTTVNADTVTAKINFPTGFGLPYGTHKIEWIANDNCAGQEICKYEFIVKDCKKPSIVCHSTNVNIMQTGMITMGIEHFFDYAFDNCTPANQLKIAIRKVGGGTGFPTNPDGTPQTNVTFTCSELGPQLVEIWALDAYGNADYCTATLNVQDNMGACPSVPNSLKGTVATSLNKPVDKVKLEVNNATTNMVCTTDTLGKYAVNNTPICDLNIFPKHNLKPSQGVTMHDLTLAVFHYAGATIITDPYTLIATDVNKDGQITDMDLSGILGMALGIDSVFANNTSWRFVPKSYQFPAGISPITVAFPEKITMSMPACLQPNGDFVAIKIGDLDQSALNATQNKTASTYASCMVQARKFKTGDVFDLVFNTSHPDHISDFQFALGYLPEMLEVIDITPGFVPAGQILHSNKTNRIVTGWSGVFNADASVDQMFTIRFRALNNGSTPECIFIDQSKLVSEMHYQLGGAAPVTLDWGAEVMATLSPAQPNPATDRVSTTIELPEGADIRVTLTQVDGTILETQSGYFEEGTHVFTFDLTKKRTSGLVHIRLESPFGTEVQPVFIEK